MSAHLEYESDMYDGKPHGWVQWKGTDVCIDLHCDCGEMLHFDGYFLYYFTCPYCKTMWEMGMCVPIYKVGKEEEERVRRESVVVDLEKDEPIE